MDNKIILLVIVLVAVAGIGGYFVGLYQGSGNFSLNVTNNTPVNDTHKILNITPNKNNTNKTNNTPSRNNTTIIF